jgi:hypothetical protein
MDDRETVRDVVREVVMIQCKVLWNAFYRQPHSAHIAEQQKNIKILLASISSATILEP